MIQLRRKKFTALLLACTLGCAQALADPAEFDDPSNLRVGAGALPDGNSMVFLGRKNSSSPPEVALKLTELNVQFADGKSSAHFEPLFLFIKNADGIRQIYSFSLPGAGGLKESARVLDSPHVKKNATVGDIPIALEEISKYIGGDEIYAGIEGAAQLFIRRPTSKSREAREIVDLFSDTLNSHDDVAQGIEGATQHYPELLKAFTPEEMDQAIDDLNRRYSGLYVGAYLDPNMKREEASRQRMADANTGQQIPLVAFANQEGYVRFPMNRFSMLAFDCGKLPKVARDDHGLDIGDIKTKYFKERCTDSGKQYIPFVIYSTNQTAVFAQVIDFYKPEKLRDKRALKVAEDIGITALEGFVGSTSLGSTSYAIEFGDDVFRDYQIRHGSTLDLVDTSNAYSELKIEAQEAGFHLNGDITDPNQAAKLDTTVFLARLAKVRGISEPEIEQIRASFSSKDPAVWDHGFQEAMIYLAADQSGLAILSHASNAVNSLGPQSNEQKDLDQLVKTVHDPAQISALEKDLAQAPVATPSTQPSSSPSKADLETEATFQKALSDAQNSGKCAAGPAVIEFQIDGLNPDHLALAAQEGLIPTLKNRIMDHAVQFNSFVTNTISVSSWSTIRSGSPEDQTVINGSSCFASRDYKTGDDNCLDFRGDYTLSSGYMKETTGGSRIYRAIKESGHDIFPDSLNASQILTDISPVHSGANIDAKTIAMSGMDFGKDYAYGNAASSPAGLLDKGNAQVFANQIHFFPCRFREIQLWLGSVDEDSHTSPSSLDRTYGRVDDDVRMVLDAAARDPILKNARIIIDSDHGVSGGVEHPDPTRAILPDKTIFMKDTSRNYAHCLAGNCVGWEDFDFVVGSLVPDEALRGEWISTLNRSILKPYNFTYKGEKGHKNSGRKGYKDRRTVLVESYGNQMESFYFLCTGVAPGKSCAHQDPSRLSSYFDLTHYRNDQGEQLNVIDRLLADQVSNTMLDDTPELKKALLEKTGNRPVGLLAMALQGAAAKASVAALAGESLQGLRDPVLVKSFPDKTAIILTRDTSSGPVYRYFVVLNFNQDQKGAIFGSVLPSSNSDGAHDPLGYQNIPTVWLDKHQWLDLLQNTQYPSAIPALSRNLTLDPMVSNQKKYESRVPDLIAYSSEGFDFNPFQDNIGNHGSLRREISHNTLYISGCSVPARANKPVLGEQIGITVQNWLGDSKHRGDDLIQAADDACSSVENSAEKK